MKTVTSPSSSGPLIAPNLLRRPARGATPSGARFALARKGFRPFFMLAATYAVLIVPLWLLVLNGRLAAPAGRDPLLWHAHEMLFGYASAVVAGFLLTAVARWSGFETAVGKPLLCLAGLWCAGRIAMLSALPAEVAALLDLAFLPALAVVVARPLLRARNRRNYGMLGLLGVLALANLGSHLAAFGVSGWGRWSAFLALDVLVMMMVVIGGRVIPMFTRNALGDAGINSNPAWDRAALGLTLASLLSHLTLADGWITSLLSGIAGVTLFIRARQWGMLASRRDPMLWVLHAGNAFIALGFVLRALTALNPALVSSATHSFTAGAIGCLTLGMMSRVSLGHTGRIIAASARTKLSFYAIVTAALLRVVGPLAPAWYRSVLVAAGTSWTLAFAIYLGEYAPILLRPRVDGTDG